MDTKLLDVLRLRVVWIAALGFFVDIFDLVLFGVVRVPSLQSLGVPEARYLSVGANLLNLQMGGMLLGGILWGVLGDKRGRVSVLFGSILLYSGANLANAFVSDVTTYGILRFIAGVGLAGELGAAVTLVAEVLPKEVRGYGTAFIPGFGFVGAVTAAWLGTHISWRVAYFVGGVLGLALLAARAKMSESRQFREAEARGARRGDLRLLLASGARLSKYVRCILIALPIWAVAGILMTFAPEIARALGATGPVVAGTAILFNYIGGVIGDLSSGWISQWIGSRKKVVGAFLALMTVTLIAFFLQGGISPNLFYFFATVLGIANGYFAVFLTLSAEQFGTNLRATVATSAPNFVRGAVVPMTIAFQALSARLGVLSSAIAICASTIVVALLALRGLDETFGKDLDYLES